MKSTFCLIHRKRTASFRIVGLMLAISSLALMLALANPSAQAQASADVPSATTSAVPSPGDWTQFHFDNMQRWNPYETVIGVNNAWSLELKWKNPIGSYVDGLTSAPAVAKGVVYFGSDDGNVYALNASTGAIIWKYATGQTFVPSSPAVVNGVVYVEGYFGTIFALDASTGAKLWSYNAEDASTTSSPAVVNGVVYFGGADNHVYALNANTGAKLWSFATGGSVDSSPAVINGVVYVGSEDRNLYALNASTGALLWSFATGGYVDSSPAVANGVVYVGSWDTKLYALNASTGAKLWSFATKGVVGPSPAVANGTVYIGSDDGDLYALNASTGDVLWNFGNFGDSASIEVSPAVANGVVYIDRQGDKLYALNASTGAPLWTYTIEPIASSSTIVDGVLYVRAGNTFLDSEMGNVYAFALGKPADLFLRAQPSTTTVLQGDLLTYAFPVWNLGPANAVHEVLNTQVPVGTTFDYIRISGTPGLGTCTTPKYLGTGQIICHENASMAPNTTWTVRLTVRVTAPSGTVITENAAENAATLADTPDPNPANNTATVSIKVQ
jgi:outer membrane protein assembly factor BamB